MSLQENTIQHPDEELYNIKAHLEASRAAAWRSYYERKQLERKLLSLEEKEEWLSSQIIPYYQQNNWLEEESSRVCEQVSEMEIMNKKLVELQLGQPCQRKPVEPATDTAADNTMVLELVRVEVERQLMKRSQEQKREKRRAFIGLRILINTILKLVCCFFKAALLSGILMFLFMLLLHLNMILSQQINTPGTMEIVYQILRPYVTLRIHGPVPT